MYTYIGICTLALPVVLMSIDIKQCARNYVKMGRRRCRCRRLRTHKVHWLVWPYSSKLIKLTKKKKKKKRKETRRMFVHKMPEIRFVILYIY